MHQKYEEAVVRPVANGFTISFSERYSDHSGHKIKVAKNIGEVTSILKQHLELPKAKAESKKPCQA